MLFKAIASSALSGVAAGFLYALLRLLISALMTTFERISHSKKGRGNRLGFFRHAVDFAFVFSLGIIHLISCYVFLDGVFSAYPLIALAVMFFLFMGLFSKLFRIKNDSVP